MKIFICLFEQNCPEAVVHGVGQVNVTINLLLTFKNVYFTGHVDNPLNDFGEKQAKAAGKALKNVIFHQAYSSDLKRAFKTCELILKENNASKINSENIVQDERIKEQHFGEFENAKLGDFIAAAIKGLTLSKAFSFVSRKITLSYSNLHFLNQNFVI